LQVKKLTKRPKGAFSQLKWKDLGEMRMKAGDSPPLMFLKDFGSRKRKLGTIGEVTGLNRGAVLAEVINVRAVVGSGAEARKRGQAPETAQLHDN
jgi:hypothetical protein